MIDGKSSHPDEPQTMKKRPKMRMVLLAALSMLYVVIAAADEDKIAAEVVAKAKAGGTVSVIVGLDVPWQREDMLNDDGIPLQRQAIRAAQQQLLSELGDTPHKIIQEYQEIPGIALEIGPDAVAVLEKSTTVTNVIAAPPALETREDRRAESPPTANSEVHRNPGNVSGEIFESVQSGNTVLVLVGLKAPWRPEGVLSEALVAAQRNAIAASQDYLLTELIHTHYRVTRRFRRIPGIALEVGLDALRVLDRSAAVTNVLKDRPAKPKN
jgi:hypothetical protein